jgi:hypothetical protein
VDLAYILPAPVLGLACCFVPVRVLRTKEKKNFIESSSTDYYYERYEKKNLPMIIPTNKY